MPSSIAKPIFSSLLSYETFQEVSLWEVSAALDVLAPKSIVSDWSGALAKTIPNAPICHMVSIDGVAMAIANMNAPVPSVVFEDGHLINAIAPKNIRQVATNSAHLAIILAQDPTSIKQSVQQASAISKATLALAKILRTNVVKWIDANNTIDVAMLERFVAKDLVANDEPIPFLVRLLLLQEEGRPDLPPKTLLGTLGLWAFGLPEIEFAASETPPARLATLAFEATRRCLASDPSMKSGSTVQLFDQAFNIENKEKGTFEGKAVVYLSRHLGSDSDVKPFPRYIAPPSDHPGAVLIAGYQRLVKQIYAGVLAKEAAAGRNYQQFSQARFDFLRSETLKGIKSGRLTFH